MNVSGHRNGGAYCRSALALGNTTDLGAEANGVYVSRFDDDGIALSAKLVIPYSATLAADETLSVAVQFQDAADDAGTGVADFGEAVEATVVATGAAGGSTETGTVEVDVDLSGARSHVRAQVTASASDLGTGSFSAVVVLFGDARQPSTKAIATLGGADAV